MNPTIPEYALLLQKCAEIGITKEPEVEALVDKIAATIPSFLRSKYPENKYEAAYMFFDTYISCYDTGHAYAMPSAILHAEPIPIQEEPTSKEGTFVIEPIDLNMPVDEAIAAITRRATDLSKYIMTHVGKDINSVDDFYKRAGEISDRTLGDRNSLSLSHPKDNVKVARICPYIGHDEECWQILNHKFDEHKVPKQDNVRDGLCSIIARTAPVEIPYGTPLERVSAYRVGYLIMDLKRALGLRVFESEKFAAAQDWAQFTS